MPHDHRRNVQASIGSPGAAGGRAGTPGKRTLTEGVLQRSAAVAAAPEADVHEAAQRGIGGGGSALPHLARIQRSFGAHDVSNVQAHTGGAAERASHEIGAQAYAMGDHVAFAGTPDLHTAAHEAAHVVQQRGGVQLKGGVGEVGDPYERHADAVADLVVQGQSAEALLDEHAGGAGTSARGGAPATQARAVQRIVRIMPAQFLSGLGVPPEEATAAHVDEYIAIAIVDELKRAIQLASGIGKEGQARKLTKVLETLRGQEKTPQEKLTALDGLVPWLNAFLLEHDRKPLGFSKDGEITEPRSNRNTRYRTVPDGGYKHSPLTEESPTWDDDPDMRSKFSRGVGPEMSGEVYGEVNPRSGPLPLKQLPWEEAKRLLPRPLINLIFDVRYQLEPGGEGNGVIDERTHDEQRRKVKSPTEPGTLRSWHQDSPGVLPNNKFKGSVPEGSQALHDHYTENSQTGAGSSIKGGVKGPQGFAEYTGTGTNSEHNTKVVLDYLGKRVYLTLTHYQYWALLKTGTSYEFWESGTQDFDQVKGRLQQYLREKHPQGVDYIINMSQWM